MLSENLVLISSAANYSNYSFILSIPGDFLSENFFRRAKQKNYGYLIRLTRNAQVCNARSGKVGSSHCYLDRRPLHEIVIKLFMSMTKIILYIW